MAFVALGYFAHSCFNEPRWLSTGLNSRLPADKKLDGCNAIRLILLAARISRSWVSPQPPHVQVRSDNFNSLFTFPQLHSLLDGSNRPILSTVLPYHLALYSSIETNCVQAASLIAWANLSFCVIPETFSVSNATAWFSRISLVDNLCW